LKEKSKTSTSKSDKTCVTDLEDSFDNELFTKRPHRKRHGLISLQQLTKTVAKRWKEASPETREKFRSLAERDKVRYTNAMMAESGLQKNSRYTNTDLMNPPIECFSGDFQINLMVKSEFEREGEGHYNTFENYHAKEEGISLNFEDETYNLRDDFDDFAFIDKLGIEWTVGESRILQQLASDPKAPFERCIFNFTSAVKGIT